MIALFRTALTIIVAVVLTVVFAAIVIVAALLGVKDRAGGLYDRIPRLWSRAILWAAGARVTLEGTEHLRGGGPFIFTCNHVSLFDIPALVGSLPRHYFVAKAELFKIPVFGPGIRAVGTIPIQRENQKAAFGSYDEAARRIRAGSSVVVFPEGTRGKAYPVRPFKKGPFVLAVKAGVPIVPCVVHGTIEILPKKALLIRPGHITVRLLEPVPTAGLDYDDRNALAQTVHDRMAVAMDDILASGQDAA
jgi:1-acyl-sn-glycerol-3-phosphate acyltransferase